MKVKKFQEGGPMPQGASSQENPEEQLIQMAQQIVQELGPEAAAMLAEAIMVMLENVEEPPMYAKKGGKLVQVKKLQKGGYAPVLGRKAEGFDRLLGDATSVARFLNPAVDVYGTYRGMRLPSKEGSLWGNTNTSLNSGQSGNQSTQSLSEQERRDQEIMQQNIANLGNNPLNKEDFRTRALRIAKGSGIGLGLGTIGGAVLGKLSSKIIDRGIPGQQMHWGTDQGMTIGGGAGAIIGGLYGAAKNRKAVDIRKRQEQEISNALSEIARQYK